jgi:hypothetical protein
MGAVKRWLMEQEEREYDEKLHEANERDDHGGAGFRRGRIQRAPRGG